MTVRIGSYGRIRGFSDFKALDSTTMGTTSLPLDDAFHYVSVNEGAFALTTDEEGGILSATTDTGDNDNVAIFGPPLKPSNGGCFCEFRFKIDDVDDIAIFAGFSETLDATTPVCPAEVVTATLTVNGSGAVIGMLHDADATTDESWLAVAGDAGAAASEASAGTTSSQVAVNNEYDVVRVEIDPDGSGRCYLAMNDTGFKLVQSFKEFMTATDLVYPVLLAEVRDAGGAQILEVDYGAYEGGRDWTV